MAVSPGVHFLQHFFIATSTQTHTTMPTLLITPAAAAAAATCHRSVGVPSCSQRSARSVHTQQKQLLGRSLATVGSHAVRRGRRTSAGNGAMEPLPEPEDARGAIGEGHPPPPYTHTHNAQTTTYTHVHALARAFALVHMHTRPSTHARRASTPTAQQRSACACLRAATTTRRWSFLAGR